MTPYSLSSDQHAHDWSQFASVDADGVNSRLRVILNELVRQAEMTKARGWGRMVLGGDLFHVRGKITPSVLNPTIAVFKQISAMGLAVDAIAGNHDLEYAHSNELGNAMQALGEIEGFTAITRPELIDGIYMVPWIQDLAELRKLLDAFQTSCPRSQVDLVIHAPVNGVIKGLPDHGLEADELAILGFRRVFAGHYHNHVAFPDDVFSIGATSHQNWSDPGTLAGFCMVSDKVEHVPTIAPQFINVDVPNFAGQPIAGNYVRMRLQDEDEATIKATRAALETAGARGIVDHSSKKRATVRGATNVAPGLTLEASVASYVADHLETRLDRKRIAAAALDVLTETTSTSLNP